jgi:hypothetical protein
MRNFMNLGKGVLGLSVGSVNPEKRKLTDVDDKFEKVQNYYASQYNKLKELCDCLSKIFESRKKQAENFQVIADIFTEISKKIIKKRGCKR